MKYTPLNLPIIEPATDPIRSESGDNLWKQLNALALSTDTAITREVAQAEEAAKWDKATIAGIDLNTLKTPGTYRVDQGSLTGGIANRPPGFSNPFSVEVTEVSRANATYRQVARMKNSGSGLFTEYTRYSLSGVFYDWENTTPFWRRSLASGTDLNTLTATGSYTVELGSTAETIKNRPPGFSQPFEVEVRQVSGANGIVRQTVRQKDTGAGTWREATRWSLSGTFYAWVVAGAATDSAGTNTATVAVFGDSQSEASAGNSWPEQAAPLLTGTTFQNQARSGDNSWEVLTRAGVIQPMFTPEGGRIPASGTVNLLTSQRLQFRADRVIATGTLAGVPGTLRHVADDQFTFTRAAAGDAVMVPSPAPFLSGLVSNARTVVFWFGGNDFNASTAGQERSVADHVIGAYRRSVVWAERNGREPVIAGVTSRLASGAGSEGFRQVQKVNAVLRQAYPDIFLDVQAYYVERAIHDAGLTPTPEDLAAMGRGEIPPQLFLDGVHLIPAAHQAIARNWIAPWLAAKGYAFTSQVLPPLPTLSPADSVGSP